MNINDYPLLREELLAVMTSRAAISTGDFDIYKVKQSDKEDLVSCYLEDMEEDDANITLTVDFGCLSDRSLDSVGTMFKLDVVNNLISEIDDHFVEQMQPALDSYWDDQRHER